MTEKTPSPGRRAFVTGVRRFDAAARAARFLERLESGEPGDLDHLL